MENPHLGTPPQWFFYHWGGWLTPSVAEGKKGYKGLDPWQVRTESEVLGVWGNAPTSYLMATKWLANIELAKPTKDMIHYRYHIFLGGAYLWERIGKMISKSTFV